MGVAIVRVRFCAFVVSVSTLADMDLDLNLGMTLRILFIAHLQEIWIIIYRVTRYNNALLRSLVPHAAVKS